MSATHTKGEWQVWSGMDNTLEIAARQDGGKLIAIASLWPIDRKPPRFEARSEYDAPGDSPSDEEQANAALLVAAPDLLAACKAALFPAGDTPQQIQDQLLAAVRKAEGTQP